MGRAKVGDSDSLTSEAKVLTRRVVSWPSRMVPGTVDRPVEADLPGAASRLPGGTLPTSDLLTFGKSELLTIRVSDVSAGPQAAAITAVENVWSRSPFGLEIGTTVLNCFVLFTG